MSKNLKRLIPAFILLLLIFVVYLTNLSHQLSLDRIQEEHDRIISLVNSHPFLAPLVFILVYIISVILIIPDSIILSILAGLVFPLPLAFIYILFSETIGATIFFAILRGVLGVAPGIGEGRFLKKMRLRFNKHEINYLLFLRFSHIFPFWFINALAAYFRVNYKTFIWTCIVGVIPLSAILADIGHSLHVVFHKSDHLTLSHLFTLEMKLALLGLGLLALVPILIQNLIGRKKSK